MNNLTEYFEKVAELDNSLAPVEFRVYTYIRFRKYIDGTNAGYIGDGIHVRTLDQFKEAVGNINFSFPINIDDICQAPLIDTPMKEYNDSSRVLTCVYRNPEYRYKYIQILVYFSIKRS